MFQKLFEEIVKKEKVLASNPQASPPLCVYVCVCVCVCVCAPWLWCFKGQSWVSSSGSGRQFRLCETPMVGMRKRLPSFSFPLSLLFLSPHIYPVSLFFGYYSSRGRLEVFQQLIIISGLPLNQSLPSRPLFPFPWLPGVQFSSVVQSCPTLCDPTNCSMPGLPVHHQLSEPTQIYVHRVGDAIQLSHPLFSPSSPALNLSQHQGLFKWVSCLHQVAKVLEFQLQHQSFQWTPRTDIL